LSRYRKSGTNATKAKKLRLIGGNDRDINKPEQTG